MAAAPIDEPDLARPLADAAPQLRELAAGLGHVAAGRVAISSTDCISSGLTSPVMLVGHGRR